MSDETTTGATDGWLLGLTTNTHWPHDAVEDATRVPVVPPYVPVNPVMVTSEPVTAPILPPDTQGYAPEAVVASGIQLPCDPDALVS